MAVVKKAKKRWVEVIGPKEFNSTELGHVYCLDPQELLGRKLQVNLMHLTKDLKKQNTRVVFEITSIKDGKAHTTMSGYEILGAHIKRVVKRNKSKVEDSFICSTKDNIKLKVKPIIVTRNIVSKPKSTAIRHKTKELLIAFIAERTYSGLIKAVLSPEIQKALSEELKKITPVSVSIIRTFSVTK